MKLGLITQWFAPEEFLLPNSVSEESVKAGFDVRVLTGFPSYPAGVIYDGYHQAVGFREVIMGADVYRVKSFLSHDANALKRILTFGSFALSSTLRADVMADVDVIYVYATPMTAAIAGWWLSKRYGIPYVLHIQDLWPESVTSSGMLTKGVVTSVAGSVISALLKPLYSSAAHIIVISPSMKSALVSRGVQASKITTVFNWELHSIEGPSRGRRSMGKSGIRFVYAGNLGVMQDVETILRAAELLVDKPEIEFHIYGSGVQESSLHLLAANAGLSNVTFHGRVTKREMSDVYATADFLLVTLKDDPLFRMTIPSKFQAAMAHGIPVVSTVQGDLERICTDAGVGWTAAPEDPSSLAEALMKAAASAPSHRSAMTERCRALYKDKFSLDKGVAAVRSILTDVTVTKGKGIC
ncbi:glycosyltransferase family 4 protein [Pseudarthrobacter sp. C1]|uniref:glycosyltransferase family 4 protein n=1 Tax=Pseudarthrobacter sp. C1 TaxID=3108940 RepID=UPI002B058F99|nr:glycosyltransferase family 4 protein [Pseudarthrobacter sp. C1]MEA3550225.1 glycosyltransferase family 4 protein [Pseudarthrobacter sp. C1]